MGTPTVVGGEWCLGVKLGGTRGVFPRGGQVGRWSGWPQPPGALWGRRATGGQDVVFVICDNGFPRGTLLYSPRSLPVAKTRLVKEWCVPGGHPHGATLSDAGVQHECPLASSALPGPTPGHSGNHWAPSLCPAAAVPREALPSGDLCPGHTALLGPWRTHWLQGNIRGPGCCRGHVASRSRAPEAEPAVLTLQSCCLSGVLGPVRPERGSQNCHGPACSRAAPPRTPGPGLASLSAGPSCSVRSQRDALVQMWEESDSKGVEIAFSFIPRPVLT